MAANPIPRQNYPRYHASSADQFTAFRAALADAFMKGTGETFVTRIAQALGKTLDVGTSELKTSYPMILPRAGFEEAIGPMVFKKYGEIEITSSPKHWHDGVSEDLRKHLSPGPTFLRDPNNAIVWAEAAIAALEKHFTAVYLAGVSGTHGFDEAPFFSAVGVSSKKINPKSSSSRLYCNHKAITLDKANPIAFVETIEKHFRGIPSPGDNGYLKLDLGAILIGSDGEVVLRDVVEQPELTIKIVNAGATAERDVKNRWAGKFGLEYSSDLDNTKAIAWARGPMAGLPHIIHSLTGTEEMPGGEFMAAKDWQALAGTWMQVLTTMLGPDSEHATKHNEILVKAMCDFAVTLMCPWSVLLIDLTIA